MPIGGLPSTGCSSLGWADASEPFNVVVDAVDVVVMVPVDVDADLERMFVSIASFDLARWCFGEHFGEPFSKPYAERAIVLLVPIVFIDGCESRLEWPLVRLYDTFSLSMLDGPDRTDALPDS